MTLRNRDSPHIGTHLLRRVQASLGFRFGAGASPGRTVPLPVDIIRNLSFQNPADCVNIFQHFMNPRNGFIGFNCFYLFFVFIPVHLFVFPVRKILFTNFVFVQGHAACKRQLADGDGYAQAELSPSWVERII